MPTTTNFGWTTPADTDLVKDGASAMRTLAGGIDTSMAQLKGGTTGQILSKTSNTDMAFTWINNDQGDLTAISAGTGISVTSATGPIPTVAIDTATTVDKTTAQTLTNKTLTAPIISTISNTGTLTLPTSTDTLVGRATTDTLTNKTISASSNTISGVINNTLVSSAGDLIYASSANTPARLAIGTSNQILRVNSGGTAPEWATVTSGNLIKISSTNIGSAVSSVAVSSVFSSTYDNYLILVSPGSATVSDNLTLQFGSTTSGYYATYIRYSYAGSANNVQDNNASSFTRAGYGASNGYSMALHVLSPNLAKNTVIHGTYTGLGSDQTAGSISGFLNDTTAYTGFTIATTQGTMTGGSIVVYGYSK